MRKIYINIIFHHLTCVGSLGRQTFSADDTVELLPTKFSFIRSCPWKNLQ